MIKGLDAIRHHGLLQPMLYVGSALLMGRYVCRLPFKATIPLSCVALVAHEISQKQISLSQNILCWSALGVGSSLIITKCSKELAKKLPHLMGFWVSACLISHWIRAMPSTVNNALPRWAIVHQQSVEERRQQYRRQSPYSEPLTSIDFFNDNGVLKACSQRLLSDMRGMDCRPGASIPGRGTTYIDVKMSHQISPIYMLMSVKTNLCFLQTHMQIGGDRFQGTVGLFSSPLRLDKATTFVLFKQKSTLECEKKILEEVIQYSSQLQNLARFLVDLLSKDGEEVTMPLEEFNFIRDKVYEWAERLRETHLAPYNDSEKEFGYAILELEKELCQIDIPQQNKSTRTGESQ